MKNVNIIKDYKGNWIKTLTHNQTRYVESIEDYKITFAIGEAGTAKTFVAIATFLKILKQDPNKYDKLILTRPVVEAGENLGFLPGTKEEKIAPYLIPLQDSINEILDKDDLLRSKIVIFPLAYMRGYTAKNSLVILDEAQNTTPEQMKLFLTRIGNNTKMVINGDFKQSDLKYKNGLDDFLDKYDNRRKYIKELNVVYFDDNDIIRDPVVKEILDVYNFTGFEECPDEFTEEESE